MADDHPADEMAELIEQYLVALANGDSAPDLSVLDEGDEGRARAIFDIVNTLANAGPVDLPFIQDPVAIRLGLVDPPDGPALERPDDPVTAAVRETEARYSFVASPAPTDGTAFERRFECRSMVENVLIVVTPEPGHFALNAAHARGAFALSEELSAVVYCSGEGEDSVVVTYGDCHNKVDPGAGWQSGKQAFNAEPLAVSLGRYFEQSDPRWDAVETLEGLDTWDDLAEDVEAVVTAALQRVATTGVRLSHKAAARDFVLAQPPALFRDWAAGVQRRDADASALADEIQSLVWEVAP